MYNNEDKTNYVMYRNKRIPEWWIDYLPDETNPYSHQDELILEQGCLSNYWHIHSSNKHPNFRGAEACNKVQEMVYLRFGGAFLTSKSYRYGGNQGQHIYHEPTHLYYENASMMEGGFIHITDAQKYYEDVIRFVMSVLKMVSTNHLQSGESDGMNSSFFTHCSYEMMEKMQQCEAKRMKNGK